MENLIEIQDVVKRFGEQTVLDHVSLSVTPGKIYGIIGRNGSGKKPNRKTSRINNSNHPNTVAVYDKLGIQGAH